MKGPQVAPTQESNEGKHTPAKRYKDGRFVSLQPRKKESIGGVALKKKKTKIKQSQATLVGLATLMK